MSSISFKISLNSKDPIFGLFWVHFFNIWSKKSFFQKLQLCQAQLHKGPYHHAKIQGNIMIQFQENTSTNGWTEGRTDPISLDPFGYRWGLTSTAAVDWHLKVQDIEYDVGLTKNYCITVSMQNISSVNTLILKIEQILVSCKLNKWPRPFLTHPLKNYVLFIKSYLL